MRFYSVSSLLLTALIAGCGAVKVADAAKPQVLKNKQVTSQLLKASDITEIDSVVHEVSGLAQLQGRVWAINDNGGYASLYGFDEQSFQLKNTIKLDNAYNIDWEDLAQDDQYLYVADIGNNLALRSSVVIYKVEQSQLQTRKTTSQINSTVINVEYADKQSFWPQRKHNFDSEALTVVDDELWLFSKNRQDQHTKLYKIDKTQARQSLAPRARFDVHGLITAADYNPQTKQLLLLGYAKGTAFGGSFVWRVDVVDKNVQWSSAKRFYIKPFAQWESIKWLGEQEFMIAAEKSRLTPPQIAKFELP